MDTPHRWDLVLVEFGFRRGSEQSGTRPALVVSNDIFNSTFPLATVLPLTKREGKRRQIYGFEVVLPAGTAGNEVDSVVMPHQVCTISCDRIRRRLGRLESRPTRVEIEQRLLDHLGVERDFL